MTYDEMINKLGESIETEEQKKRREKRERASRIIDGVTRGLLAGVNLAGTVAGGNNMKLPESDVQKRQEAQKMIREKREQDTRNLIMKYQSEKEKAARAQREQEGKDADRALRQQAAADKAARDHEMLELKKRQAQDAHDLAAARVYTEQQRGLLEEAKAGGYGKLLDSQIARNRAAAYRSYNGSSGRGGGGNGNPRHLLGVEYGNDTDYNRAVMAGAHKYGVKTVVFGKPRRTEEIAAEVERKAAEEAETAAPKPVQTQPAPKKPATPQKPAASGNAASGKKKTKRQLLG